MCSRPIPPSLCRPSLRPSKENRYPATHPYPPSSAAHSCPPACWCTPVRQHALLHPPLMTLLPPPPRCAPPCAQLLPVLEQRRHLSASSSQDGPTLTPSSAKHAAAHMLVGNEQDHTSICSFIHPQPFPCPPPPPTHPSPLAPSLRPS